MYYSIKYILIRNIIARIMKKPYEFITKQFYDSTKNTVNINRVIGCSVLLVAGLWFVNLCYSFTTNNANEMGDSFGIVNSLFSGLAFAGLIVTILLQKEELKEQRKEIIQQTKALNQQSKELESQKVVLENQLLHSNHQRFETTFFNMIEKYRIQASMLTMPEIPYVLNNSQVQDSFVKRHFNYSYSDAHGYVLIKRLYNGSLRIKLELNEERMLIKSINILVTPLVNQLILQIDSIFEYVYHHRFYDRLYETDLSDNLASRYLPDLNYLKQYEYIKIFKASLTYDELVMLAYIGAYDEKYEHMKKYIEDYSMLDRIQNNHLLSKWFEGKYDDAAYNNKLISHNKIKSEPPQGIDLSRYINYKPPH
jgi:hypothetical protein